MQDLTPVIIDTISDFHIRLHAEMMMHGPQCSLNHWDISQLYDTSCLFAKSPFDGDISQWDVAHVESMSHMFSKSAFTGKQGGLKKWDVGNVLDFQGMFYLSAFESDISSWRLSPYIRHNGFELFLTSITNPQAPTLLLPVQERFSITAFFDRDPVGMNAWLNAQEGPWSRYHWDALVAGIASLDWAGQEAIDYVSAAKPVLESLDATPIQIAKSLQQQWSVRQILSPSLSLDGLI